VKTISGEYIYLLNGEPTGVTETFSVERSDDDIRTSSTRDASAFGTVISVETVESNSRFATAKIEFQCNDVTTAAVYELGDGSFTFRRTRDGGIVDNEQRPLPHDAILFPLMRVFQGHTILAIAKSRRETPVIVPFVENPNDLARLLSPTTDYRTAERTNEKDGLSTFKYLSKHYDDKSEFVIREDGLLASYRFPQAAEKVWEVVLSSEFQL